MSELQVGVRLGLEGFTLEVDFAVAARGVIALFGPSGAGKTTILRCIAGLVRARGGRVAFDGESWQDDAQRLFVPSHERGCGYVFQEASLFSHLSVRGNLEFGYRRVPAEARRVAFEQAVELLGIASLLARRPANLSGGERQRVAIARALLASPRLLLMDEPLASVDSARKGEILYYIERLRDDLRMPIVYVSHALDEVLRLADSVVEVADGRVTAVGTVHETIGKHAGATVLDAVVADQDLASGLARLRFGGGELYTSDLDALPGERVRVRISARDVALALSRPRDASFLNVLEGTVTALGEGSGASIDIQLDVSGTPFLAQITRKSATALAIAPGRTVYALIKAVAIDRHSVGYA